MGNCVLVIHDWEDNSKESSEASSAELSLFSRWFRFNRVQPELIQQVAVSSSSSAKLPPGLWEIMIDGRSRCSAISALTMDDFSVHPLSVISQSANSPQMMTESLRPPRLTVGDSLDEEAEQSALTKEMLLSYIQSVGVESPRVCSLLKQLNEMESGRDSTQPTTPRTTQRLLLSRQYLLEDIREQFRQELNSTERII